MFTTTVIQIRIIWRGREIRNEIIEGFVCERKLDLFWIDFCKVCMYCISLSNLSDIVSLKGNILTNSSNLSHQIKWNKTRIKHTIAYKLKKIPNKIKTICISENPENAVIVWINLTNNTSGSLLCCMDHSVHHCFCSFWKVLKFKYTWRSEINKYFLNSKLDDWRKRHEQKTLFFKTSEITIILQRWSRSFPKYIPIPNNGFSLSYDFNKFSNTICSYIQALQSIIEN